MKNIFKENKRLLAETKKLTEENKILKAQNEALAQFRESFEAYYREVSGVKIITRNYDNAVTLNGAYILGEMGAYYPVEEFKRKIIYDISKQLEPFIEYDMIDGPCGKEFMGRLVVVTK